jgi:hypothetical protein
MVVPGPGGAYPSTVMDPCQGTAAQWTSVTDSVRPAVTPSIEKPLFKQLLEVGTQGATTNYAQSYQAHVATGVSVYYIDTTPTR